MNRAEAVRLEKSTQYLAEQALRPYLRDQDWHVWREEVAALRVLLEVTITQYIEGTGVTS
jgi:hypothetical protein